MKNVGTIFKKEIRRYFTDRRMLFALFAPGILIFLIYSIMGRIFSSSLMQTHVENTVYHVAYTNNSGAAEKPMVLLAYDEYLHQNAAEKTNSVEYTILNVSEVETAKEAVKSGAYDVLLVFSDQFEITVKGGASSALDNYIYIFYNGEKAAGTMAYTSISSLVEQTYKNFVVNIDKNGVAITPNLGRSDYQGAKVLSVLAPMLTMSLLSSAVMSICPDAIAGEKERGTLASVLLTPIKRSDLALGKILALLLTALVSGITSSVGLLAGLPSMMSGLNLSLSPTTVVLLGILVVTTLLFLVSIGTLISTFAKTTKECNSYMAPLMIVSMVGALVPMMLPAEQIGFAFIPFVNVDMCMNQLIVNGSVGVAFMVITIGVNLLLTGGLIALTAKLFHNERVMVA